MRNYPIMRFYLTGDECVLQVKGVATIVGSPDLRSPRPHPTADPSTQL
jgi:hypothetical protein